MIYVPTSITHAALTTQRNIMHSGERRTSTCYEDSQTQALHRDKYLNTMTDDLNPDITLLQHSINERRSIERSLHPLECWPWLLGTRDAIPQSAHGHYT